MRHAIFIFLLILNLKCVSFNNYLQNRSKDVIDIPVLGFEKDVYGVSAWVWCFGGGAQYAKNGLGVGIRSGTVGQYKSGGRGSSIYISTYENHNLTLHQGNSFLVLNSNSHIPGDDNKRSNKKAFSKFNTNVIFPLGATNSTSGEIVGKWCDSPLSFEISLGIYYGVRFGLNISELFDFLLGISTLDPMEDDE
ncbi:LIC13411 family adhesin [Leptospira levettii]|uniref:LIC13411 family adhesin n=1 Tax=Leptospira levettii TaxID=2023178 RepID=UPI0010FFE410|nr:hypothetical protein [Leptospira levettii]TGL08737.1 hypothetical protein EHQ39_10950 [Leptospira levettii]